MISVVTSAWMLFMFPITIFIRKADYLRSEKIGLKECLFSFILRVKRRFIVPWTHNSHKRVIKLDFKVMYTVLRLTMT